MLPGSTVEAAETNPKVAGCEPKGELQDRVHSGRTGGILVNNSSLLVISFKRCCYV